MPGDTPRKLARRPETWPDFRATDREPSEVSRACELLRTMHAFYALFPSIAAGCDEEIRILSELREAERIPPEIQREIERRDAREVLAPGLPYWRFMTALVCARRLQADSGSASGQGG